MVWVAEHARQRRALTANNRSFAAAAAVSYNLNRQRALTSARTCRQRGSAILNAASRHAAPPPTT